MDPQERRFLVEDLCSLADSMERVAKKLNKIRPDKAKEMLGAAKIAIEWAKEIENE